MHSKIEFIMKKDLHPANYRMVVFKDFSCNEAFLVRLEISNKSHPFFTGKMKFIDTAGRIDKFNKKFQKFTKA